MHQLAATRYHQGLEYRPELLNPLSKEILLFLIIHIEACMECTCYCSQSCSWYHQHSRPGYRLVTDLAIGEVPVLLLTFVFRLSSRSGMNRQPADGTLEKYRATATAATPQLQLVFASDHSE